ncbi:50S ribosomal protein L11 methyltransferase [Marinihelvus fidelis]|uniref:50S ribosomal protein L11 methyltransferase n=1 Tax=Marinihelvus fidelis TaxID=2613842 RepID=UPI001CD7C90D|nr:50S ribosomal protein L11 methyltransferase [Marinihelvus fidelis]
MSEGHIEVAVRTGKARADLVESLLLGQGALAVTLSDSGDQPLLEPGVGETPLWDDVVMIGLFNGDIDAQRVRAALSLLVDPNTVSVREVRDQAWERAWMDRFKPMRFGERLWIVPHGMDAPEPDADIVRLDPGLAFGTGTHATTRLCLEWLDAADVNGRDVLDYGCGSGVLGIAAAIVGARHVRCIDNDPQAVTATADNAERNGIADRLDVSQGQTPGEGQADIVISNILAGILQRLAPELAASVRPGGALVLAGVLDDQADSVIAAFGEHGIDLAVANSVDGWVRLEGVRA